MTIKGVDFVKMTDEELRTLFFTRKCPVCMNPVDPNSDYVSDNEPVHEDCYYNLFSEELDKHPIGIPRMHRGA